MTPAVEPIFTRVEDDAAILREAVADGQKRYPYSTAFPGEAGVEFRRAMVQAVGHGMIRAIIREDGPAGHQVSEIRTVLAAIEKVQAEQASVPPEAPSSEAGRG